MDDQITGEMLGKYQILEEIGRGGFGTVYRAKDTVLGREVAIKVLNPLLMRDAGFVERFRREAKAAARLEHPHIVPIYDADEVEGRLFIVMRLVRGESLAQMIKRGRLSWEDALAVLRQVGTALAYAHAEGIIHRDIKPGNILLDQRMGPMLSDFGLAHLAVADPASESYSSLGSGDHILGTLPYIAPELWEGVPATPGSDIYALGCVTYEMLTGKLLFGGPTTPAIIKAHLHGAHLPAEWPLDTPEELTAVLTRAVTGDPTQRYSSVEAFLDALKGLQTIEVEKKRAAAIARLLAEAQSALEERRYEDAITAAEALLALQAEHAEGAAVLQKAQAQLARRAELAARVAEAVQLHEEKKQVFEASRTELEAKLGLLGQARRANEDEREQLLQEKAQIEAQLQELQKQLQAQIQQEKEFHHEVQGQEKTLQALETRVAWLERAQALLAQGDFEALERHLDGTTVDTKTVSPRPGPEVAPEARAAKPARSPGAALTITPGTVARLSVAKTFTHHKDAVTAIAFSPSGTMLFSGGSDKRVCLQNTLTGDIIYELPLQSEVNDIAFSPNGEVIGIALANGMLQLWQVNDKRALSITNTLQGAVTCLSFTPDGNNILYGAANGKILRWPISGPAYEFASFGEKFEPQPVSTLCLSADGTYLAATSKQQTVPIWQVSSRALIGSLGVPSGYATSVAFAPDGITFAISSSEGSIRFGQIVRNKIQPRAPFAAHNSSVRCMAFSPDGALLASGAHDGTVRFWSLARSGQGTTLQMLNLDVLAGPVNDIAFSPDGTSFAAASTRESVKLWRI